MNASDNSSIASRKTLVGAKEPAAAAGSFEPTFVEHRSILELSEAFKAEFCVQGHSFLSENASEYDF